MYTLFFKDDQIINISIDKYLFGTIIFSTFVFGWHDSTCNNTNIVIDKKMNKKVQNQMYNVLAKYKEPKWASCQRQH